MSSLNAANLTIALTSLFFLVASFAVLFSAFLPPSAIPVRPRIIPAAIRLTYQHHQLLDVLAQDTHYKYFVLLIIPTSSYFVIANWVGWQYYQNS
ncbi:hypothetical protein J3R82DRAFT_5906 [Butyriboletus roseoflavus]|nr:hypothetical protein J3R82DRAFT_5906 [Butyriboletus roseoflavus]